MKRYLIIILLLLVSCGDPIFHVKEFLFKNPDVTLQINNGTHYDKYANFDEITDFDNTKEQILTINRGREKQEILLSGKWQKIKGMGYYVRGGG